MQIIITYFDQVKGPIIFYSIPRKLPTYLAKQITLIMDIGNVNHFFTYTISVDDDIEIPLYNFPFEIKSPESRGYTKYLMITLISNKVMSAGILKYYIKDLVSNLTAIPNLSLIFNKLVDSKHSQDAYSLFSKTIKKTYDLIRRREEDLDTFESIFTPRMYPETQRAINRTVFQTFVDSIYDKINGWESILFKSGNNLATKVHHYFKGETIDVLTEELSKFWVYESFGVIDEINIEGNDLFFNVYDCFECVDLDPNIGHTVCHFDEGLLSSLLSIKLKRPVSTKELECYATGAGHCRFQVHIEDPKN